MASRLRKLRRALITPAQWEERVAKPRRELEAASKAADRKLRRLAVESNDRETAALLGISPWTGRAGTRF